MIFGLGFFLLICSLCAFGNTQEGTQSTQGIFMAPIYNTGDGFDPYQLAFEVGYTYEGEKADALAAIFLGEDDIQFTARGVWWPFVWSKGKLGFGGGYNFTYFEGLSVTNNLLGGFWIETYPVSWFSLKVNTVSLLKMRTIFAIRDENQIGRASCRERV